MERMSNAVHGANPRATAASAPATATTSPTTELVSLGQRRLLANYRQPALVLARGQGCELWDTAGRRYLDMYAGVAVASLGHAHARLAATIAEQAGKLMHTSNYFFNEENVRLAGELCEKTGYDRVFFCNSGAEANEAMLKLGRRHHFARGDVGRTRFIAFHQSFHGRSMGAVALTGNPKYHEGFGPMVPGITHVPYGDLGAVEKELGPDVAAVFVETVQGEGGVMPAPPGFLPALRALCDASGALLLVDEVQTGIGRTGKMLGSDHEGVRGDAIALAKGLGGGFPIGAMLVRAELAGALPPGSHGSTFGGNPLASAAARTVLAVIEEEGLLDQVTRRGEHLARGLADIAARRPQLAVGERGRGLLRGLRLAQGVDPRKVLDAARERGVLLTVAGADVLRFTPPLIVTEGQIDEALSAVDAALASL
jgi:acetylornithine/N-succinyldiaminopimelate aminotransferase